jgi:hypothetical protein
MENVAGAACSSPLASLLPYLQHGPGRERLKLSLLESHGAGAPRSYPFDLLDDSAPYCRLVQAAVVTDAGTVLKKVVLQLQKDHYPSPTDPLRRVTNCDIDRSWQEAFAVRRGDPEMIFLSSQTDRDKRLVPQAPLFYCREIAEFFHPVCPSCGLPLSLCTDEEYLRKTGLFPYATSLKRYLHCRPCCQLGLQEIYLYERDHADPLSLKDRWSLIESFAAVDEEMDPEDAFPCARCGERDACFGQQHLARMRMIPFSFYPFHMLLRSAPSLRASDFLAHVAGAPRGELQQQPELEILEDARLFPPGDRRSFLEILFLKLSFLHEVLLQALPGNGEGTRTSMDRICVTLAPLSRSLPLFWNFSVTTFDSVVPAAATPLGTGHSTHLGITWFRTLLSSRDVTATEVLHAVVDHLALPRSSGRQKPSGKLAELLVPQNIYWEPGGMEVPSEWRTFWERASSLGLDLVNGSTEEVLCRLAALLSELKAAVLAAPATQEAPQQTKPDDEAILRSVVGKLIDRYIGVEEGHAAPEPDEFEAATLIIPSRLAPATAQPAAEDPMMETVLIPQAVKEGVSPEAEWGDEPVMETVILSPDAAPGALSRGKKRVPDPEQEGPDLLETVLLAPPVRRKDLQE